MSFFDANEYPDQPSFGPVPAGDYVVSATTCEVKVSMAGGEYLAMDLVIMEGQYSGRKLFPKFTLSHSNPKAVEIGRRMLATVCKAVKVLTPQDPSDLCGIPLMTRVVVKPRRDTGEPQAECSSFWGVNDQAPPSAKAKPQVYTPPVAWDSQPEPQANVTKPSQPAPWAR